MFVYYLLPFIGRNFNVQVDPTQLNPGGFYYSEIEASILMIILH